ncbi:MAG: DUF4173 domain-containing protein [Nocardioides sp.]|uniref:DUF4153 domain-containing protein n=1 Tax=Nocardioides sp. TaxID=35761 RepID=UPI0039E61192
MSSPMNDPAVEGDSASTTAATPLAPFRSLKLKLGLLVAASATVAAVIGTIGAGGGVAPWLAIPVTIALALGVTQLLAVGMTAPLREMTLATRRMASGDYSIRVTETARDEVGDLARAFNTMAADLASVDQQRRELVATVAHEVRTPLTALSLRLENLTDGIEPVTPEALDALLGQTRRLSGLVADLLDLSRVQAGLRPLDLAEVPVLGLLTEVVAELTLPSRAVQHSIEVRPGDLTVRADPARLRQLLTNVLENAARHSPTDAVVSVRAEATANGWRLTVSDRGPGIAPEDRERAFERFGTLGRLDGSRSDGGRSDGGGTGLGLAIARWVAELHGGSIRFVDPPAGAPGARLLLEMPAEPSVTKERPVPHTVAPTPPPSTLSLPIAPPVTERLPPPAMEVLFGAFWPERELPARRFIMVAAIGGGVLAALLVAPQILGLGAWLVLAACGATVLYAARDRRDPFMLGSAALCALLASTTVLRDAEWIGVLCLLAGAGLLAAAVTRARTVPGFVVAAISWPLAGLRGLPWLGRVATGVTRSGRGPAVVRTAVLSAAGVLVFGALFASADALVAHWVDMVLPDWNSDSLVWRTFTAVFVGGVVLAASYLAMNPPAVDRPNAGVRRPARRRFEWLVPVVLIEAVFVVFLLAQVAEVFGGDSYVRHTTGLTYSEYAHQGFWQLVVGTLLTLAVVSAANHKASVETAIDRRWLRGVLGVLCVLALVVVWSALHRMSVYDAAYGFTRTRLLVWVFEGWLGLVILGVAAAGAPLRGGWLPRFALLTGAAALAGLALLNPDAWIAQHNLDRYQATGKLDWVYLQGLSADAVPVIMESMPELPAEVGACAVPDVHRTGWRAWTWGQRRALAALDAHSADPGSVCTSRMLIVTSGD